MDPHVVSFITFEDSTDLIVSFAIMDPNDGSYLDCLNVIRTPKYERFLDPQERCPHVYFPLEDKQVNRRPLRAVSYANDDGLISIRCEGAIFTLDLSRVDAKEFDEMVRLLRKMCRDFDTDLLDL